MKKLLSKELKMKFIESLNELNEFNYEEGNPFLIKISNKKYYIFLKNLSSAFFKNLDIIRIQLPQSDHFTEISKTNIPLIALGYNVELDTFVTWNPKHVKERLNFKSNVSLYSRLSVSQELKEDEFKIGYLSNGDKFLLFKRKNTVKFFEKIDMFFNKENNFDFSLTTQQPSEPYTGYISNKLQLITDNELLQQIMPLLKSNRVLQAVEITSKYYLGKYTDMTFKDWYKIVNDIYKKII